MNQTSTWKPLVKRLDSGERERLKIAKELLRKKQYDEALVEFNAVLESNSQSINALLGIGLVYLRQEHLDEALARFKQAKLLDPLQPKPYLLEGFCFAAPRKYGRSRTGIQGGIVAGFSIASSVARARGSVFDR